MRNFASHIKSDQVLDPVVLTADAVSASVDLLQYGSCQFNALVGESGDTLGSSVHVQLEVQESDDNSTFTAVADADLDATVTGTNTGTFAKIDAAAEDDTLYQVECPRVKKRYTRVAVNLTGTHTNGIPIGILANRGQPKERPLS